MSENESKNPFEISPPTEKSQEFSEGNAVSEKSQEKNTEELSELEKSAEKTANSVLETLDEYGHELDTEEDGNIFWLIQNVVWNIVKSLLAIGAIVFLLWVIWGDSTDLRIPSFFSTEKTEETPPKKIPEKRVVQKKKFKKNPDILNKENTQKQSITSKSYQSVIGAKWNIWLGKEYRKSVKDSFGKSVLLLEDTDTFFSIPLPLQVKGRTDQERSEKVNTVLRKISGLLARYQEISGIFEFEIQRYSQNLPLLEEDSRIADAQFLASVSERKSHNLQAYIHRKVENGNKVYSNQNQIWARQVFLQEFRLYTEVLLKLKQNIEANKNALIRDVQVYDFLNDPFERVLK